AVALSLLLIILCLTTGNAPPAGVAGWRGQGDVSPRGRLQPGSALAVEQLAANQHAADFIGAGTDLVELGITQQASRRELVDIAIAAEGLDRLEGDLHGRLRGVHEAGGGI